MFDKICIKSNNGNEQKIDIAFLIDTMLFYGEVNVLVHENELVTLLNFFDIDILAELIRLKRMKLHVRQNILGVSKVGNADNYQYGIGFYRSQNEDVKSVLYRAHRKIINNSIQNNKFADRFYYIVSPFEHESIEDKIINEDLNNTQYLKEDKVTMDFAFFVIAFNIKKMCAKLLKAGKGKNVHAIFITLRPSVNQHTTNIKPYYLITEKIVA